MFRSYVLLVFAHSGSLCTIHPPINTLALYSNHSIPERIKHHVPLTQLHYCCQVGSHGAQRPVSYYIVLLECVAKTFDFQGSDGSPQLDITTIESTTIIESGGRHDVSRTPNPDDVYIQPPAGNSTDFSLETESQDGQQGNSTGGGSDLFGPTATLEKGTKLYKRPVFLSLGLLVGIIVVLIITLVVVIKKKK